MPRELEAECSMRREKEERISIRTRQHVIIHVAFLAIDVDDGQSFATTSENPRIEIPVRNMLSYLLAPGRASVKQ